MVTMGSRFIGGPMDGMLRDMRPEITGAGRDDWAPPLIAEADMMVGNRNGVPIVEHIIYERSAETQLDAEFGSVWHYTYVRPTR